MRREPIPFVPTAAMHSIYAGQRLCGYFLHRRQGTEVYTPDGKSLGTFPTQDAAADALFHRNDGD
jgi:hypothetical protein